MSICNSTFVRRYFHFTPLHIVVKVFELLFVWLLCQRYFPQDTGPHLGHFSVRTQFFYVGLDLSDPNSVFNIFEVDSLDACFRLVDNSLNWTENLSFTLISMNPFTFCVDLGRFFMLVPGHQPIVERAGIYTLAGVCSYSLRYFWMDVLLVQLDISFEVWECQICLFSIITIGVVLPDHIGDPLSFEPNRGFLRIDSILRFQVIVDRWRTSHFGLSVGVSPHIIHWLQRNLKAV